MVSHRSLLLAALLPLPVSASDLWVVDDDAGPGVDFTSIQAAIDQANDGDGVLVRDGEYDAFTIASKSLSVFADPDGTVVVGAPNGYAMTVRDLGASQSVLLHGLTTDAGPVGLFGGAGGDALLVTDNLGPVWLEEIELECGGEPTIAAVVGSSSVAFVRCNVTPAPPGSGIFGPYDPEHALFVHSSMVWAYDSTFRGREGVGGPEGAGDCSPPAQHGGDGARLMGGAYLFASGCRFWGGDGGDGEDPTVQCSSETPGSGSDGGAGVRVDPTATFERVDTIAVGGSGGSGGVIHCISFSCPNGAFGGALEVEPSGTAIQHIGQVARSIETDGPVQEGTSFVLGIDGAIGDLVLGGYGLAPGGFVLPETIGPLTLGLPIQLLDLGSLPTASVDLPLGLGDLGPSVDFQVWYLQGAFVSGGDTLLGAPSALIVVDSSF